eukprot:1757536-Alexandrium_andersonii.AAC.1
MPPFVDPNAVHPYPVLDPVREAQPYGPLRPPAPSEPAAPEHSRAPQTGGTEAAQGLVVLPPDAPTSEELALAGRGRRPHREP